MNMQKSIVKMEKHNKLGSTQTVIRNSIATALAVIKEKTWKKPKLK